MGASSPKYRTRVEWRLLDRTAATGGMSVASLLPSASLPTKSLFSLSLAKRYHNCFLFLSVPRFRCTLHQPRCLCKDTASDSALLECSSSCSLENTFLGFSTNMLCHPLSGCLLRPPHKIHCWPSTRLLRDTLVGTTRRNCSPCSCSMQMATMSRRALSSTRPSRSSRTSGWGRVWEEEAVATVVNPSTRLDSKQQWQPHQCWAYPQASRRAKERMMGVERATL